VTLTTVTGLPLLDDREWWLSGKHDSLSAELFAEMAAAPMITDCSHMGGGAALGTRVRGESREVR